MDIRLTFDGVVDAYDRARPSYPDALIDILFAALPEQPSVLEIGPGTGQLTASLLARGAQVTAVELGPNLAQTVRDKFESNPSLQVVNASFEQAPLPHASFDAVTVATAYHWIEPSAQAARPIELLRPGGVLGVIDLIQVDSPISQGYFERVQPIYDRYDNGRSSFEPKHYDTVQPRVVDVLRASELYTSIEVFRERWDQTYTSSQYRDLLWSYSGTQMKDEPERTQMVDELIAVIDDEYEGTLTRPLVATLTLATAR